MNQHLGKSFMFVLIAGILMITVESAEARRGPVPPGKVDSYNGHSRVDQPGSSTWKPQYVAAPKSKKFRQSKSMSKGYLRPVKPVYQAQPDYGYSRGLEVTPQRRSTSWGADRNYASDQNWKQFDSSWSADANYAYPMVDQKDINGIKPDKHFRPSGKLASSGYTRKQAQGDNPIDYLADAANTAEKIISVPFKA